MVRAFGVLAGLKRSAAAMVTIVTLALVSTSVSAAPDSAAPPTAAPAASEAATGSPATEPPHNAAATWREVRGGVSGFTTVKGVETGVLVSPQGQTWRAVRNGLITPYGGALLVLVAAAIAAFFYRKGAIKLQARQTGRNVERFTRRERQAHWLVAISFVCLAFSGMVLLFGKHVLLWLIGYTLFSWLGWFSKNLHILAGFCFIVGVVPLFGLFWRDNLWHKSDAEWIRKGGGIGSGEHVPSGRFNFGEKAWFWFGLTGFGLVMIFSGLALTFPQAFASREAMQIAEIIHATSACLVIAMSFGHIYMGTIGMEGAYKAMKTGQVDEAWAKEHHSLWYEEKTRDGGNA